jgi:hypothetical protein
MSKRKINKDKEQLKNFFINTYKFWKSKMQIDETEWANNFPRDARELFLLINGWEWRRRRLEPPFWMSSDKQRFKSLVFDGILSFRPKRKKFLITIRTPYCPALLKYFPCKNILQVDQKVLLTLGRLHINTGAIQISQL